MMVSLTYRDGAVFIRTKPRMAKDDKVPWSPERQFYPDPDRFCRRPADDAKPRKARLKKPSGWRDVFNDVTSWCNGEGTVRPSPRDRAEMLSDLRKWGKRPHRQMRHSQPPEFPSFVNMPAARQRHPQLPRGQQQPAPAVNRVRRCRCGSRTHLRTNHRDCPLNPGRRRRRRSRSRRRRSRSPQQRRSRSPRRRSPPGRRSRSPPRRRSSLALTPRTSLALTPRTSLALALAPGTSVALAPTITHLFTINPPTVSCSTTL